MTRYILAAVIGYFPFMYAGAQLKTPYELTVEGVKVIVQPSGNEILEIQAIIKGGVQNYPLGKDGIENLAIQSLTEGGTQNDDKNSFKNKLDKIDARIGGYTGMDYATFTMNCIKGDFEQVWPLYSDALLKPAFDAKEFARIKQVAINQLKENASRPDVALSDLARQTAYAGKDYAKMPNGTPETVSKLTLEEVKAYYKTMLSRAKMVFVVVGDIDRDNLQKKLAALLTAIPAGKPFVLKKGNFTPTANTFLAQKRDLATNYIQGVSAAPQPGSPDYNAFILAMRIFYNRQFVEVRTKNGLSYAPSAYFSNGLSPSANIAVSTTDPNKYIGVVNELVNTTRKDGFKESEVKDMKTSYITRYFYSLETNSAQAGALAANEVLHNNWRRAITLNEDMKPLTAADLNRVFNKYVNKFTWVYLGDPAKANPSLFGAQTAAKTPSATLKTEKKN